MSTSIKEQFQKCLKISKKLDDIQLFQISFLSKIATFSSYRSKTIVPMIKKLSRPSMDFSKLHNLSQNYFRIKYLFKRLDIVLNEIVLDEFFGDVYVNEINVDAKSDSSNGKKKVSTTFGFFISQYKNLLSWKPEGRLITTLYDHQEPIEKLLNLNDDSEMNKFISFGRNGRILLWGIEDYMLFEETKISDIRAEILSERLSNNSESSLNFRAIAEIQNKKFAVANNSLNQIEIYKVC